MKAFDVLVKGPGNGGKGKDGREDDDPEANSKGGGDDPGTFLETRTRRHKGDLVLKEETTVVYGSLTTRREGKLAHGEVGSLCLRGVEVKGQ